jgi:hypothetical protein
MRQGCRSSLLKSIRKIFDIFTGVVLNPQYRIRLPNRSTNINDLKKILFSKTKAEQVYRNGITTLKNYNNAECENTVGLKNLLGALYRFKLY